MCCSVPSGGHRIPHAALSYSDHSPGYGCSPNSHRPGFHARISLPPASKCLATSTVGSRNPKCTNTYRGSNQSRNTESSHPMPQDGQATTTSKEDSQAYEGLLKNPISLSGRTWRESFTVFSAAAYLLSGQRNSDNHMKAEHDTAAEFG
jgi:hypothetical protein